MIDKDYLVTQSNNSIIYQVCHQVKQTSLINIYPNDWVHIFLVFLDTGPFLEMKNGNLVYFVDPRSRFYIFSNYRLVNFCYTIFYLHLHNVQIIKTYSIASSWPRTREFETGSSWVQWQEGSRWGHQIRSGVIVTSQMLLVTPSFVLWHKLYNSWVHD